MQDARCIYVDVYVCEGIADVMLIRRNETRWLSIFCGKYLFLGPIQEVLLAKATSENWAAIPFCCNRRFDSLFEGFLLAEIKTRKVYGALPNRHRASSVILYLCYNFSHSTCINAINILWHLFVTQNPSSNSWKIGFSGNNFVERYIR